VVVFNLGRVEGGRLVEVVGGERIHRSDGIGVEFECGLGRSAGGGEPRGGVREGEAAKDGADGLGVGARTSPGPGGRASGRPLLGMKAAEHGMTNLPPFRPRQALHLRHDARPDPMGAPHAVPEWQVSSPGLGEDLEEPRELSETVLHPAGVARAFATIRGEQERLQPVRSHGVAHGGESEEAPALRLQPLAGALARLVAAVRPLRHDSLELKGVGSREDRGAVPLYVIDVPQSVRAPTEQLPQVRLPFQ
jgi:hypothetical protein